MIFDSDSPANNASARAAWLTALNSGPTQGTVTQIDFESGFSDGQSIGQFSFPSGMRLRADGMGSATVRATSNPTLLGGADPVGSLSGSFTGRSSGLIFDFSSLSVNGLGFVSMGHTGGSVDVFYTDGTSERFNIDAAGSSGQSEEFYGIWANDKPGIERVRIGVNSAGDSLDGGRGFDNIQYDTIPEPAGLAAVATGGLALVRRRRR
ncbi:MAG: PEP-CTERM sorting domain-containing protein [Planctomycetota bacterium]